MFDKIKVFLEEDSMEDNIVDNSNVPDVNEDDESRDITDFMGGTSISDLDYEDDSEYNDVDINDIDSDEFNVIDSVEEDEAEDEVVEDIIDEALDNILFESDNLVDEELDELLNEAPKWRWFPQFKQHEVLKKYASDVKAAEVLLSDLGEPNRTSVQKVFRYIFRFLGVLEDACEIAVAPVWFYPVYGWLGYLISRCYSWLYKYGEYEMAESEARKIISRLQSARRKTNDPKQAKKIDDMIARLEDRIADLDKGESVDFDFDFDESESISEDVDDDFFEFNSFLEDIDSDDYDLDDNDIDSDDNDDEDDDDNDIDSDDDEDDDDDIDGLNESFGMFL